MSDPSNAEPMAPDPAFTLSLRQRRLRLLTAATLIIIVSMIFVGRTHPFFQRLAAPDVIERVRLEREAAHVAEQEGQMPLPVSRERRAITAKLIVYYLYWSVCLFLTFLLFLFAWFDYREIRKKTLLAQRDMWKEIASGRTPERRDRPADS